MKKRPIFLAIVFFMGVCIILPKSRATAEFSKDPNDLEAFTNTTWILGYGETDSPPITTSFSLGSEIQTTDEGYVKLVVNTPGSELGNYDPGVLKVETGDAEDTIVKYIFVIDDTGSEKLSTYEMEKTRNVNILKGSVVQEYKSWGVELGPFPGVAFKWGAPLCDQNNDGKLGLAEAIHYLKIATDQ